MAQKWLKMAQSGPNMTQNGPRMTQNDPIWPKNGPHFFQFFFTEKAVPQTFSLLECMIWVSWHCQCVHLVELSIKLFHLRQIVSHCHAHILANDYIVGDVVTSSCGIRLASMFNMEHGENNCRNKERQWWLTNVLPPPSIFWGCSAHPVAGLVERDIQVQVLWWRKIFRCRRYGGERYPDTGVVVEKAPMSDLQVEASVTQPGPGNSCSI